MIFFVVKSLSILSCHDKWLHVKNLLHQKSKETLEYTSKICGKTILNNIMLFNVIQCIQCMLFNSYVGTDELSGLLACHSVVCIVGLLEYYSSLNIMSWFIVGYLIIPWKDSKTGSLWLLTAGVKKQQVIGSWKSVTRHLSWEISRLQVWIWPFLGLNEFRRMFAVVNKALTVFHHLYMPAISNSVKMRVNAGLWRES